MVAGRRRFGMKSTTSLESNYRPNRWMASREREAEEAGSDENREKRCSPAERVRFDRHQEARGITDERKDNVVDRSCDRRLPSSKPAVSNF